MEAERKYSQVQYGIHLITLRTFSDLGGGKFRLPISKMHLNFRKVKTELINKWIPIIDKKNF